MKFCLKTLLAFIFSIFTVLICTDSKVVAEVDPSKNPSVERNTQEFLKVLNSGDAKPMEEMAPQDARAVLTGAQSSVRIPLPPAEVSEKTIVVEGKAIKLNIVRPAGIKKILPAFMFFHGGGWVLGDFPTHERFVRDLVSASGVAAIFVNYTPSPEARYPVAINEAYLATKWIAENGAKLRIDGKRLAVVGNSAGGNIAAVVALMAKDKGTPAIKCQVLFWPVTNADFDTESYNKYSNGYFLTRNMMKWFWDNYLPDEDAREQIYVSPLKARIDQLNGLPPALIQTAENDVLRDEGEEYARKLNEAGVEVTSIRYNGMIHDYGLLNALSGIPEVRSALSHAAEELKRRLK